MFDFLVRTTRSRFLRGKAASRFREFSAARATLGIVGIAAMCRRWGPVRCWDALGLPPNDEARAPGGLGIRWDCREMLALGPWAMLGLRWTTVGGVINYV